MSNQASGVSGGDQKLSPSGRSLSIPLPAPELAFTSWMHLGDLPAGTRHSLDSKGAMPVSAQGHPAPWDPRSWAELTDVPQDLRETCIPQECQPEARLS